MVVWLESIVVDADCIWRGSVQSTRKHEMRRKGENGKCNSGAFVKAEKLTAFWVICLSLDLHSVADMKLKIFLMG